MIEPGINHKRREWAGQGDHLESVQHIMMLGFWSGSNPGRWQELGVDRCVGAIGEK
jgi:hypothetical protein